MASEMEGWQPKDSEAKEHEDGLLSDEEIRLIALVASSRTAREYTENCAEIIYLIREQIGKQLSLEVLFKMRENYFRQYFMQQVFASTDFGNMINNHNTFAMKQDSIKKIIRQLYSLFPNDSERIIKEIERIWQKKNSHRGAK